jgi:hypothetical protein
VRAAAALAAIVVAVGLAACGDSPEDTAHQHGKDVGTAFRSLTTATSAAQLQTATQDLKDAVGQVTSNDGDRVQDQLRAQKTHLDQLIGDFKRVIGAPDAAARDTARTQMQGDLQDLRAQAGAFQSSNDSVANAFWDGVQDGYDG